MTVEEAKALVGCVVRIRQKVSGRGRGGVEMYGQLLAVAGDKVLVKPKGHRKGEWIDIGGIVKSKKHMARMEEVRCAK